MNRPLVITAIGVVVIIVAIAANFLVWQQEVAEESLTGQSTAPQAAADAAAEAAEQAAEKARSAAKLAEEAKMAAEMATEKAKSPEASDEAREAAAQAESQAAEAAKVAKQAAAEAEAAQAVAEAAAQAAKVIESAPEAAPQTQTATASPTAPATTTAPSPAAQAGAETRPSFDVVRINPKGDTVMAGRAEPGSKTRILDHGKVIGEVTADTRGEWVFIPEKPLPPGTSELTLESSNGDGRTATSDSSVMLVVPEKGKDIAGRPTDQPSQPLALKVPTEKPEMVTVPDRPIPSVVLQKPTSGEAQLPLTIDLVDYDDEGRLSIGGRAASGALVQLYLDNKFIGRATAGEDGAWRVTPEIRVKPGLYTLRADQVDASGKVIARIVIPFARAKPLSPGPGRYVVVQPGNSLWRIARRTYGSGFDYSVIYEANTEQIADPDMIFPGQIFALPKGKG